MEQVVELLKYNEAELKAIQEKMGHNQAIVGRLEAQIECNQVEMEATVRASQDKMKAMINSIQFELEEMIKNRMENILASVTQQTQGLCEELNEKIMETQRHVQVLMASIDTWTGSLKDDIMGIKKNLREVVANTRKDLQTELNIRAFKIGEAMDNFLEGLEATRCKFKMRLAKIKARAALGVGGHTGSDARRAKPPKFDGSTSWAVF
jgi:hypothetical protein